MASATTATGRSIQSIVCELSSPQKSASAVKRDLHLQKLRSANPTTEAAKIMLQPRLCTLRSYGPETRDAVVKLTGQSDNNNTSQFFASLADYIESSKKSHDFETISGRLAMIVFAATVSSELVTGDSLFKKLDMQQLAEGLGVCLAIVASAATFAWFTSARNRIGQIFTLSCNAFVDSLIDNLVEALFYESELNDWSED
ncbi:stress enhanced protein 2 [Carex littledalei]|uniref:Stress enhanced protein 2 n=1 Tax=Carex littledalei TaxID=544730 RepID=A0A833QRS2_9POAL|nr:stress enhanced protein 2 [Carex littledalei]